MKPNERASVAAGFALLLTVGRRWSVTTGHDRSATQNSESRPLGSRA